MIEVTSRILNSAAIPQADEIVNNLFPNIWVFVSHVLAFSLLLCIFLFLLWKPLKRYLKQRHEAINKDIKDAADLKKSADEVLNKANIELQESKTKAIAIIKTANDEAKLITQTAQEIADKKLEEKLKEADSNYAKQIRVLKENLETKTTELALDAVQEFLRKKISEKENKELIDQIIKDIKNDKEFGSYTSFKK